MIIDELAERFNEEKHILKVIEESMELGEVLTKTLTKAKEFKPPKEKIIEEMGDLIFRMRVLARKLQIEDAVQKRVKEKGAQLEQWYADKIENKADKSG